MNEQTPSHTSAQNKAAIIRAIESQSADDCIAWFDASPMADIVHDVAALSTHQRTKLLALLPTESAAEIVEQLPFSQTTDVLEELEPSAAAQILEVLPSDECADIISELDEAAASAILDKLDAAVADDLRRLVAYDEESAGGLMLTEYLAFVETQTVADVIADLTTNAEKYAKYNIQYTYVVDKEAKLMGVVPLRRLLLAGRNTLLREVMIANPVSVVDQMELQPLASVFREHPYMGLPVTTLDGVLRGVVERSAVEHALTEEADDLYRQSQGIVGGEELRSMPLMLRSRRRLAWLSANIVLNMIAASVIAMHQDTLSAVIALAVFLPMISDMSGCSGNQAVAVSMRELTLGVTRPQDLLRVLMKESSVGLINGVVLGVLIGCVASIWQGSPMLGVVVGGALMINTVVAVCIGGSIPLVLKRFKLDPALASGPILTTVTDMCGFLLALTFASMLLTQVPPSA
ncbi:MAG: magnesium transporter [Phycisphaeraceae bacterium]|nr:magnesium transporter [Phycisphaerales bacterium]MCB9861392.1 magnesium transporter [Phycisphaeraceae bacterium]